MATDPEIRELTRLGAELINRIDGLVGDTGDHLVDLAKQGKSNRRFIWALAISVVLDIALTIAMAVGFNTVNTLSNRVNETQKITQEQVLCPLYQQFINADTPKSRELAKANGQDLKVRDEAFRTIRRSYEVLGCK